MSGPSDIQLLIDRAARLQRRLNNIDRQRDKLSGRLETLKEQIATSVPQTPALAVSAKETAGGGRSWNLGAANGSNVRVTKPANKLLSKITGDLVEKLRSLCGPSFPALFVPTYNCAKKFRELIWQKLEKDTAEKVLALCEEESTATVTIS